VSGVDQVTRERHDARARRILRDNDRGGYTVPTSGLYPFQWNWDSCLVALGWATFDEARAWQEIETLFGAQWDDGMLPHIVFHRPDPGYFPGPEVWRTGRAPPTSGITQPPVAASCVRRIVERARDRAGAEAAARRLFPKLLAWQRWFHRVRDPDDTGLVAALHPWETGMDNSPAWDEALARVEVAPDLEPYTRRDTQHVAAAERPTAAEYDRYMTLVELYRAHAYGPDIVRRAPFRVADVAMNCVLLRADRDLLWLADRLQQDAAPRAEIAGWIGRAEAACARFRDPATGLWHSYDLRVDARVPTPTHAGFLAFWAGVGDGALADGLEEWLAGARYGLASVRADDPRFERRRYWRGPIWAIANFLIGAGLAESGFEQLAQRLKEDTAALIAGHGFFEYFDPCDGRGCGGDRFSWTAAMWLTWAGPEAASNLAAGTG
jgi:glycogen debranching enzyme